MPLVEPHQDRLRCPACTPEVADIVGSPDKVALWHLDEQEKRIGSHQDDERGVTQLSRAEYERQDAAQ